MYVELRLAYYGRNMLYLACLKNALRRICESRRKQGGKGRLEERFALCVLQQVYYEHDKIMDDVSATCACVGEMSTA
jgi:hypothetical protein